MQLFANIARAFGRIAAQIRRAVPIVINFLTLGIWRIDVRQHPRHTSFLITTLRIIALSLRGFYEDKCQLRASALTFFTLLSIVPVLALAFGVAKGFGLEKALEDRLIAGNSYEIVTNAAAGVELAVDSSADAQHQVLAKAATFAKNMLAKTSGGVVAGIGVVILIWTVIKLLGNVEHSFNEIWGVVKGRHLGRKLTDYLAMVILCPLLIVLASSLTVTVSTTVRRVETNVREGKGLHALFSSNLPAAEVEALMTSVSPEAAQIAMSMAHRAGTGDISGSELAISSALSRTSAAATNMLSGTARPSTPSLQELPWYDRLLRHAFLLGVAPLIMFLLRLAPYIMVWLLFSVVYLFMPNTPVKLSAGIVAGIVAGTLYQLVQLAYVMFQIGVSRYNAIYGSFAALPLFLIWLQISWMIVLYGAELSFAYQNVDTYAFEPDCRSVSTAFKRLVALRLTHAIVDRFLRGVQPLSAGQLATEVELPIRLTRELLHELVAGRILSEVLPLNGGEPQYQPARDVHALTISNVIQALDTRGDDTIPLADSTELEHLRASLDELGQSLRTSPGNKLLMDV